VPRDGWGPRIIAAEGYYQRRWTSTRHRNRAALSGRLRARRIGERRIALYQKILQTDPTTPRYISARRTHGGDKSVDAAWAAASLKSRLETNLPIRAPRSDYCFSSAAIRCRRPLNSPGYGIRPNNYGCVLISASYNELAERRPTAIQRSRRSEDNGMMWKPAYRLAYCTQAERLDGAIGDLKRPLAEEAQRSADNGLPGRRFPGEEGFIRGAIALARDGYPGAAPTTNIIYVGRRFTTEAKKKNWASEMHQASRSIRVNAPRSTTGYSYAKPERIAEAEKLIKRALNLRPEERVLHRQPRWVFTPARANIRSDDQLEERGQSGRQRPK